MRIQWSCIHSWSCWYLQGTGRLSSTWLTSTILHPTLTGATPALPSATVQLAVKAFDRIDPELERTCSIDVVLGIVRVRFYITAEGSKERMSIVHRRGIQAHVARRTFLA